MELEVNTLEEVFPRWMMNSTKPAQPRRLDSSKTSAALGLPCLVYRVSLRVHVPNNWVLRALVIVIIVQVLGKYMIIRYLDP